MKFLISESIQKNDIKQEIASDEALSNISNNKTANLNSISKTVDTITKSEVHANDMKSPNFFRNVNSIQNGMQCNDYRSNTFVYPNPNDQPGLNEQFNKFPKPKENGLADGGQRKPSSSSSTNIIAKENFISKESSTTSKSADKIQAKRTDDVKVQQTTKCIEVQEPEKSAAAPAPIVNKPQKTPSVVYASETIKSSTPLKVNVKSDHDSATNVSLRMPNKPAIVNEKPQSAWKTIAPYDVSDPVKVIVQYVEEKNPQLLWIMLQKNENQCNQLLLEINKIIKANTPGYSSDEIKSNNLVAALFEGIFYRAVILETFGPLKEVLLRLLDYGNEFYAKCDEIKAPIPQMLNAHQYAFQVKLLEKRSIELGETITIKFTTCESSGIWIVSENLDAPVTKLPIEQPKPKYPIREDISNIPIPENVPLKLLMLDASLFMTDRIVTAAVFNEKVLLDLEKLNEKFTTYCIEHATKTLPHSPKVGEICCAIFADDGSWYRTECINIVSEKRYLLKFVDYGNFSEVNVDDIREIPREYLFQTSANACLVEIGKKFVIFFMLLCSIFICFFILN